MEGPELLLMRASGPVKVIAMEEHMSGALGEQSAEPWLRVCVVLKR
jgi:hypothetical protein